MNRPDLIQRLVAAQVQRAQNSLLRQLRTISEVNGAYIVVGGKRLLSFASNDYLGLAQHPALCEALITATRRSGVGATAAHLLGGHRDEHMLLEEKLAKWTKRDKALLFSTGYMANLGTLGTLLGERDLCVQDKFNHACLLDGARLAGADLKRYLHNDALSAERQLATRPEAAALLATDGVFSMDGDVAPLRELAALCIKKNVTFMVDDAHGLGVLGHDGAGSVIEAGLLQDDVPVLMATLGKALGVGGAFVAGSTALIDGLVQFARTYIYTTAMPPALAAAASVAVDIAQFESWRREQLHCSIVQFRHGAMQRGYTLLDSRTPIQPVLIGDNRTVLMIAAKLEDAGFFVPAIRSPTVPVGKARLRIALSALHEQSDIERLLDALAQALPVVTMEKGEKSKNIPTSPPSRMHSSHVRTGH